MDKAASASFFLMILLLVFRSSPASGNAEGDALYAFKTNLVDSNGVLESWNSSGNHCKWLHVTCDGDNRVTRVDLGNANLTGQLVSRLGELQNLQYLELYSNNLSGKIPPELGNLSKLVCLDLYLNSLSGPIPDSFGNLQELRFLRLNNNSLSGNIPMSLTTIRTLQVLDLSNNHLTGLRPVNGSFSLFTIYSFAGNNFTSPHSTSSPSPSPGNSATRAFAGGVVVAAAALLFAALAIEHA